MKKIHLLIIAQCLFISTIFAQSKIEKLEKQLDEAISEEEIMEIEAQLVDEYILENDTEKAYDLAANALKRANDISSDYAKKIALIAMGNVQIYKGEVVSAYENYMEVLEMDHSESQKDQIIKAKTLNGLANIYYAWGDYEDAIRDNLEALKIRNEYQDKVGEARCYNNMGIIYDAMGNYEDAIKYYSKALNLYEELKRNKQIAAVLDNLASAFKLQAELNTESGGVVDYTQAETFYNRSLKISKEEAYLRGQARTLNNLGILAYSQKKYDEAIAFYFKALQIDEENEDAQGMASTYNNIGKVFQKKKEWITAIDFFQKSLSKSMPVGAKYEMQISAELLAEIYERLGQYEDAYSFVRLSSSLKEELFNNENAKKIANLTSKYEIEKKQKQIEILQQEKELTELKAQQSELKAVQQRKNFYFAIGGAVFLFLLVAVLYSRNQIKTKANKALAEKNAEINQQKEEIMAQRDDIEAKNKSLAQANNELEIKNAEINQQKEEIMAQRDDIEAKNKSLAQANEEIELKNQNITDSINYAKRIQQAIFPPTEEILSHFSDGFIYLKPRDIVSGDFYWYSKEEDKIVLVAADCTGHGVSGAFMTVMGSNLLNEVVKNQKITDPVEILNHIDEKLKASLVGEQKIDDGMDITILTFDRSQQKVYFAGAKNPLYYVQVNQEQEEMQVIKGSKYPIGNFKREKQFELHEIDFRKGDIFYMFSDGFPDQFGEETGRKYMIKRFREFLFEHHQKPMREQIDVLHQEMINWKGHANQTDDIIVMGIKV